MRNYPSNADIHVLAFLAFPVSSTLPARFFLPSGSIVGAAITTASCTGDPVTAVAHVSTHPDPVELPLAVGAATELPMPTEQVSHTETVERAIPASGVFSVEVACSGGSAPEWSGSITILYRVGVL